MISARFCTSCGAPVVDGVCTSCKKKAVTVPGWDPAPTPAAAAPAAPGGPVGPPPGPSTPVGPPVTAPMGPASPLPGPPAATAGPPVGYPVSISAGPPVGYPPAPIAPPPPRPRRSHGGLIALLLVVLLAAGGGVWWSTHRSSGSGRHAPTSAAQTHASSAAPIRTTRVVLGTVHSDVPATFVKVAGTPAGIQEYGNAATTPTEYFQLSRTRPAGAKKPSAYSAAERGKLGDAWQAQAVTSATSSSCPKPVVSDRTDAKQAASISTGVTLTCKDAKGGVIILKDRFLIPNDALAYHGRVVAPSASWTKDAAALGAILASMAPA